MPIDINTLSNIFQLLVGQKALDFKLDNIRFIIDNTANKRYFLFGDYTQHDMEIYTEIALLYPQSILKIYVCQTSDSTSLDQKEM